MFSVVDTLLLSLPPATPVANVGEIVVSDSSLYVLDTTRDVIIELGIDGTPGTSTVLEIDRLTAVALGGDGRVLAAGPPDTILVFDSELRLQRRTALGATGALLGADVAASPDGSVWYLAVLHDWRSPGPEIVRFSPDAEEVVAFHEMHPDIVDVPYIHGLYGPVIDADERGVFVSGNSHYEVTHYGPSGEVRARVTDTPEHFTPFDPPDFGEFSRRNPMAYEAWLRSFSQISDILVLDRYVLVESRSYDPDEMTFRRPEYTVDLYDHDLRPVALGVPTPGKVVAFAGRPAFLRSDPDRGAHLLRTSLLR